MGVVLALPFTYGLGITPAVVLLTAMYVSGTYGGAFTAILFRIPGEPIDVPLLWDGYKMAQQGEAAKALGYTLFAALIGGQLLGEGDRALRLLGAACIAAGVMALALG